MTKIYRTTGSKRISVIISDNKGRYLVVRTDNDSERSLEFPGFSEANYDFPEEQRENLINKEFEKILGITIDELVLIEVFTDWEYPLGHYIFVGNISSGVPSKIKYKNIYWKKLEDIDDAELNIYGLQVYQKLSECTYCRALHSKKDKLDDFFDRFMIHDAGELVVKAIKEAGGNDSVSKVCTRYYLSHLRAIMVEDENRKKNSTIQNYLKLYKREDLAEEVEDLLQIRIAESMTLRDLIKTIVDRQIAHYDAVSKEEIKFKEDLERLFLEEGPIPLTQFVEYIEEFVVSLVMEMWFYAGELGVDISDTGLDFSVAQGQYRDELLYKIQMMFVEEVVE